MGGEKGREGSTVEQRLTSGNERCGEVDAHVGLGVQNSLLFRIFALRMCGR
jgi:hypothetical protein